jgi:hypothetical protein
MRKARWVVAGLAAVTGVGVGLACSGSSSQPSSSSLPDGGGTDSPAPRRDSGTKETGSTHGNEAGKLHGDDAANKGDALQSFDGGLDGACAAHTTPATVIPAYLVFVMDRSDSMHQYGKWPACSAALEAFFSDSTITGVSSSLTFMPFTTADADTGSDPTYSCTAADYVTPEVPMTTLPSSVFTTVIGETPLKLGTPTTPALEGATKYAVGIKQAHPGTKVVIVLATDGYPAGCTDNTTTNVVAAAHVADKTDGIPVYVIGVGPDDSSNAGIADLNKVAEAGATGSAFFIPTEMDAGKDASVDASVTEQAFLAAIRSIQGSLGCDYAIPAAPSGETLNYDDVNVVLTSGSTNTTLPYSDGCSDPSGWTYDYEGDAGTPDKIVLCSGSCKTVKDTSATSSLSVELGCKTTGGMPPK